MTDYANQRRQLEAQVERWTAEAKKLTDAGKDEDGLALYRRAADQLSGAPWLQHRTAELARKLRQNDSAIIYFRRAATAFQMADFPKRAVAPLRTAWSLALEGLPGTSKLLVDVATEQMQLQRQLGFIADANVTFERTNAVLRAHGFSEIRPHALETPLPPPPLATDRAAEGLKSDVAPRSAVSAAQTTAQDHALSRVLGRRG